MQTPQYRPKPWAEPILTLMKAFNIKFQHLAYSGEADISYAAAIFEHFKLPFWEQLMTEYQWILRHTDLNGNRDARHKKHFEDSPEKWMNTRVLGSHYLPKLARRLRDIEADGIRIPHKDDTPYDGPSITNPRMRLVTLNQKNTLGAYLGQTGNVGSTTIRDLQFHPLTEGYQHPAT